jgi:hypothetical protein
MAQAFYRFVQSSSARRERQSGDALSESAARPGRRPIRRGSRARFPTGAPGDTIPLGARTLRVVDVRYDEAEDASVLVVEDMAVKGNSAASSSSTTTAAT